MLHVLISCSFYSHSLNLKTRKLGIFRKSPRPSLLIKRAALGNLKTSFHCTHWHRFFPLKKAPPLISVFFNGLYTPFGSPVSGGQKPQEREDVTALRCSEPLRYKVGGASKPSPCFAGWDRLTIACYGIVGLLLGTT